MSDDADPPLRALVEFNAGAGIFLLILAFATN